MTACVSDATLPQPRQPRYRTLDAWRGLACLMVVVYHATFVAHVGRDGSADTLGSTVIAITHYFSGGVSMFFVISGYCIAAAADSARRRRDSLRSYFARRFRRIFPPLWAAIAFCVAQFLVIDFWLWPGLLWEEPWPQLRPWWYSGWQWLGNLTLTESWRHYFVGNQRGHFPGQAWTLCYEEQFYAVTGLLLAVLPRRIFAGAMVMSLAVGLTMVVSRWSGIDIEGFFFDGRWLTFAAGILVYYRVNYADKRSVHLLNAVLLAGVCVSAYDLTIVPGGEVAFPFALLLSLVHRFDDTTSQAAALVPFALCGRMCYSLYLVHQLPVKAISAGMYRAGGDSASVTLLVTVPVCLAVSIALGWLFYRIVECRFLNQPVVRADAGPRLAWAYAGESR